ncbi:MAG: oligosaccharide flippase family protein, partial [Acetobacteraceae bacterium]
MTNPEAPQQSILARTARGAGWVIGWRMTTRLIGMASTLVLARLLVPDDFGLVALANIFAGAVEAFSTVGVEQALIRAPSPDRDLYDTGFTINLLRGLLTATLIALLAHPLAAFYGDLRLAPLLYLLAAATAADGLENIGIIEFRRDLTFDKE